MASVCWRPADKIVYAPDAVVYHRAWRPPTQYVPLRWNYGLAQGAYYTKHAGLRDRYMLGRFWRDIWRHVRRVPTRLRLGDRRGARADMAYVLGLACGALRWLISEQRSC